MASHTHKEKVLIQSEYSAQRLSHPPNPAIGWALKELECRGHVPPFASVADVGCGKLRHYRVLSPLTKRLVLVDTRAQIDKTHVDSGTSYTIREFAKTRSKNGKKVSVFPAEAFARGSLALEIIFCVAVVDVVPRSVRRDIIAASASNVGKGGHFVVIAPRNDQSITSRFSSRNRFQDGHIFVRRGITTFICNFKSHDSLCRDCTRRGLTLLATYRHIDRYACSSQDHEIVRPSIMPQAISMAH